MGDFDKSFFDIKSERATSHESLGNQYDNYGAMKIKETQLFKVDFLMELKQKIENLGLDEGKINIYNNEFDLIGGSLLLNNIKITFDKEYNLIRISNRDFSGYPININLKDGSIYVLDAQSPQEESVRLLQNLKNLGILQDNIPYISDSKLKTVTEENTFVKNFINKNNRDDLPFSSTEVLKPENTINVLQQGSIIINDPKEGQSLYTFGAGPCLIIAVYDNDTGKIGLAHIDALVKGDNIIKFLSYFSNPDIKIISGDNTTSANVIKAIKKAGMENQISYMNSDLDGQRSDAVAITIKKGKPEILYGYNPNIKLSKEEEYKLQLVGYNQSGSLSISIK